MLFFRTSTAGACTTPTLAARVREPITSLWPIISCPICLHPRSPPSISRSPRDSCMLAFLLFCLHACMTVYISTSNPPFAHIRNLSLLSPTLTHRCPSVAGADQGRGGAAEAGQRLHRGLAKRSQRPDAGSAGAGSAPVERRAAARAARLLTSTLVTC